jgi:hypothetical protein
MKKITLFIFLLVLSSNLFAQLKSLTTYPKVETKKMSPYDWKEVDQFKNNGLPRKAIDGIKELQEKAIKEKNVVAYLESFEKLSNVVYKAKFDNEEEENFYWEYAEQASKIPFPFNNITYLYVGKQVNRLFYRGSLGMDDESRIWQINDQKFTFKNQNFSIFRDAILQSTFENLEGLMKVDVALLNSNKTNKKQATIKSLFEYLAQEVINYSGSFFSDEKGITDSSYYQTFKGLPFNEKNIQLQLYFLLENATFKQNRVDDFAYWANKRIDYVYNKSSFEKVNDFDKETIRLKSYQLHEELIEKHAASIRFSLLIIQNLISEVENKEENLKNANSKKDNYVLALKKVESTITNFPNNDFLEELLALKNHIKKDEVSFYLKTELTQGKPSLLNIQYRNVEKVLFNIYKIEGEKAFKNPENELSNYIISAVYSKTLSFPKEEKFIRHDMDFILPKIKDLGKYIFIVGKDQQAIDSLFTVKNTFKNTGFSFKVYNLSNLSALTTIRGNDLNFMVKDAITGKPISKAKIEVIAKDKSKVTLFTDKEGKGITPIQSSVTYTISKGEDVLEGRSYLYGNRPNNNLTFNNFFLDRQIFRPGQVANFKAIIYQNDSSSRVVPNHIVRMEVKDGNQKVIYNKGFTTNEFGTISGSMSLPKNGFLLGRLSVYLNGRYTTDFSVEEYKIPTFSVELDDLSGKVKIGDTLSVSGKANALAGYPISNALVKITISQSNYFPRWCVVNYDMKSDYFTTEVKTNEEGEFNFKFLPKSEKFLFGSYFDIKADVTDINGEVQGVAKSFYIGHESYHITSNIPEIVSNDKSTDFEVEVKNSQYVTQKGKTIHYTLEKINQDTWKPISIEESEFKSFTKKEFKKAFPDVAYYTSTKSKPNILKSESLVASEKINLTHLLNDRPGKYKLTFSIDEPNGEKALLTKTFDYVDISNKKKQHKASFWVTCNNTKPDLGETVTVTVGSSNKKMYVYQENVYSTGKVVGKWLKIKGREKIEMLVTDAEKDGFTIHFFSNIHAETFQESISIQPIDHSKEIKIELATERDFLTPGEKEKWTIKLIQEQDKKINTELLFSMYDKALDKFTNNTWNTSIKKSRTYTKNWSNVYANKIPSSFNAWGSDYNNRYDFYSDGVKLESKSNLVPSMIMANPVSESDSETISDEKESTPRTNFAETAFFYPHLSPNENNEATFEFTTPDALTTWKFRAFVHSKGLSSGSFNKEFIAKKEIIVQPNAPRFLREKDAFVFSSKVVNTSDKDQEILVRLKFKNPTDDSDISSDFGNFKPKTITVKANSTELVEWDGTVPSEKHQITAYYISAKGAAFQDAEQKIIPILSNRTLVTKILPFVYHTTEVKSIDAEKLLDLGNTAEPIKLHLEIETQPLWSALMSLPSLMNEGETAEEIFFHYFAASYAQKIIEENPMFQKIIEVWKENNPRVWESALAKNEDLKQLLLSETPWLLDAQNESERRSKIVALFNTNNLENNIAFNLEKLKKLQQANGAWGWYDVTRPNVSITQSILLGLGQMEAAGITIDKEIPLKAIQYLDKYYEKQYVELSAQSKKLKQGCSDYCAQWLLARAYFNSPMNDAVNYYQSCLNKQWINKNLHLQALIGLNALANNNETLANKIKASFLDRASNSNTMGMYWNRNSEGYNWSESTIATQASIIEFFSKFKNEKDNVEAMKLFLLQQKQATAWNSNKATVAACYALTIEKNTTIPMHTFAKIGENEFSGEITEGINNTFDWNGNAINKNKTQLELTKKEEGVVFGSYYLQYLEDLDKVTKTNEALRVQKHYYFSKGGKEVELKANDTVSVGTKITVKISINTNRDMDFVHLKDSKGMGCEAQQSLSVKNRNKSAYYLVQRDASTSFFIDALSKGTHSYTYDFFVTNKGKVHFGPAIVESNYAPSLKANSNGFVLVCE